jgi:Secretion system C-terminal sorting domain
MKKIMYKSLLALALIAIAQLAQAQVFYTQDFSGGALPAGWTTTDGSNQNAIWEFCSGPAAGCVDLYNRPQFASTSAANGFMVLDSDGYGELPSNHVSRLTTANIDCSAATQVFATFESAIGVFEVPSDGNVLFRVSNDGGTTWTPFNFIPGLSVSNRWSANPHVAAIDITAVAANKPAVMLQWQWTGRFEYWWMLDDVKLTAVNPTPANNLALTGFYYPVSSFATPATEIGTDTFGFSGLVSNVGTAAQTNVKLKAEVLNATGTVLFTDMASIASLPAGYTDSLIVLPNTFAPELPIGAYEIRYSVSADATDAVPANNVDGDEFVVTDFIFSKENGPTGALRPGGGGDYAVGNLYSMSKASMENYKALGFQISAATNPGFPLEDVVVTAYLFKVNDDIDPGFNNFDDATLLSNSLELKGIGSFDFPTGAANYSLQAVIVDDVNGGTGGVALQAGARYFAVIGYNDASNVAFHAYSDETNHTFVSSMVYTDAWYLGGFGEDYNPVIRLVLELSTSTDNLPLPESAMMLFPNPISDVLNLEVSFDESTDATITIADINGRVINIDNRKGLTKEVLTYQLPQLAAGTYLARIATEKGTKTKKFVVAK